MSTNKFIIDKHTRETTSTTGTRAPVSCDWVSARTVWFCASYFFWAATGWQKEERKLRLAPASGIPDTYPLRFRGQPSSRRHLSWGPWCDLAQLRLIGHWHRDAANLTRTDWQRGTPSRIRRSRAGRGSCPIWPYQTCPEDPDTFENPIARGISRCIRNTND